VQWVDRLSTHHPHWKMSPWLARSTCVASGSTPKDQQLKESKGTIACTPHHHTHTHKHTHTHTHHQVCWKTHHSHTRRVVVKTTQWLPLILARCHPHTRQVAALLTQWPTLTSTQQHTNNNHTAGVAHGFFVFHHHLCPMTKPKLGDENLANCSVKHHRVAQRLCECVPHPQKAARRMKWHGNSANHEHKVQCHV
jgi:hypothetical protein